MPVIQKITYFKDGNEIQLNTANISPMTTWVTTLTTDEQSEFAAAETRQRANQQAKIESGDITSNVITSTTGVTWNADSEASVPKYEQDPTWLSYWERWLTAHGLTITETFTTV